MGAHGPGGMSRTDRGGRVRRARRTRRGPAAQTREARPGRAHGRRRLNSVSQGLRQWSPSLPVLRIEEHERAEDEDEPQRDKAAANE